MSNLVSTYQGLGRLDEAEGLEAQVLEAHRQLRGPEYPDTVTCMNNLAFTLKA
jgi:hypothetical protein